MMQYLATRQFRVEVIPPLELLESIKEKGILIPVTVTQDMFIIDGEDRVACAKILDMPRIPAQVVQCTEAEYVQMKLRQAVKIIKTAPEQYKQAILRLCGREPDMTILEFSKKMNRNLCDTLRVLWYGHS